MVQGSVCCGSSLCSSRFWQVRMVNNLAVHSTSMMYNSLRTVHENKFKQPISKNKCKVLKHKARGTASAYLGMLMQELHDCLQGSGTALRRCFCVHTCNSSTDAVTLHCSWPAASTTYWTRQTVQHHVLVDAFMLMHKALVKRQTS